MSSKPTPEELARILSSIPAVFVNVVDEDRKGNVKFLFDDIEKIEYSIKDGSTFITTIDGKVTETTDTPAEIFEFLPKEDFMLYSDSLVIRSRKSENSMSELEKILRTISKKGIDIDDKKSFLTNSKSNLPPSDFGYIAYELLSGSIIISSGYKTVKVHPLEVEFYYHEESGTAKDPIVYHRNREDKPDRPMFKLGMLNNHISGIDLTFEHYNESLGCVCRASALIRKFKIEDSDSLEILEVKELEDRPTYLPGILLGQFSIFDGFTIKWEGNTHTIQGIAFKERHNVKLYDENGKKTDKQDPRPWRIYSANE